MERWFPAVYDALMAPLEKRRFKAIRRKLIDKAQGRVLEIGTGSGVNFPFYRDVEQVDGIEPNPAMIAKSRGRIAMAKVPIVIHQQSAERLEFGDASFDTVISTLVFCTIPDPAKALEEIKRVCKPGGAVLFFEHVQMEQPLLAKIQDWLTPLWKRLCDGCRLNQNTVQLIKDAGFRVVAVSSTYNGLFLTIECTND